MFYLIGQSSDSSWIRSHLRQNTSYKNTLFPFGNVITEDVFCSLEEAGPFNLRSAQPVKHIVEGPTATNHSDCEAPSHPLSHHLTTGGGDPVESTKEKAMATALNRGLRSGIRLLAAGAEASKPASREFHATGVKRMGGHGHDEPYYLHAKHMYNLHRMKHQALKATLSVIGAVSIGVGVPVYAVIFQQKKTASG